MRVKCPKCKADITDVNSDVCECGNVVAVEKIIQLLIGDNYGKVTSDFGEEGKIGQNARNNKKKR